MKAGRELEIWLEQALGTNLEHPFFGYQEMTLENGDGCSGFYCPRCGAIEGSLEPCAKHYSTDITAAMQLAEKMREKGWFYQILARPNDMLDGFSPYECQIFTTPVYTATSDTLPEALALACYKALSGTDESL